MDVDHIVVALILAVSVIAVLALPLLRRNKWAERRERGLCVNCGYDLRASADRCPECGRPVPPKV